MQKITLYALYLLLTSLQLLFFSCTTDLTGGTSTSENGRVAGVVFNENGTPASQAEVVLLPAGYNPVKDTGDMVTDTTDSSGTYNFPTKNIKAGEYSILSKHSTNGTRAFTNNIIVVSDTDSVAVDLLTLKKPGSIKIAVPAEASDRSGYVYIPGTTNSVSVKSGSKYVILDSVPVGTVESIIFDVSDSLSSSVLQFTIDMEVQTEDTATLFITGWKYNRELHLNTSASGADISNTLYNFPVLIRLNAQNFNFSEATSLGKDLLFVKEDGTYLPYEIERWDAQGGRAEIWLKVDTLAGNSITTITMHWGNQGGSGGNDSTPVFDTADGFSAVWHLGEAGDSVRDAGENNLHGVRIGSVTRSEGAIGYGQRFAADTAADGYFSMGNVLNLEDESLTISAWIKRSGGGLETIIAKSDGKDPSAEYGWNVTFGIHDELHAYAASGGTEWGDTASFDIQSTIEEPAVTDTTKWHFVTLVIDRASNNRCKLYLDGVNITDAMRGDISQVGYLENTADLRIGSEGDGDFQWTGSIDECIVAHKVRSDDWIRLCYSNQGSDDRLVEFK